MRGSSGGAVLGRLLCGLCGAMLLGATGCELILNTAALTQGSSPWDGSVDATSATDSAMPDSSGPTDAGEDAPVTDGATSSLDAGRDALGSDASDGGANPDAARGDSAVGPVPWCILDGGAYVANGILCTVPGGTTCWNGACVASAESCAASGPGVNNCGVFGTDSCCASLRVDGGAYYRTYVLQDGGEIEDGSEQDLASVSSFRLDKYLVTVGRFRQFVNASSSGWVPPPGSGRHAHLNGGSGLLAGEDSDGGPMYEPGWVASDDGVVANLMDGGLECVSHYATWTTTADGGNENLPINCVTWEQSYAFCIWDGAFLPSEAEWEYAAAGGSQQRAYPWGSAAPDIQHAIFGCLYNGSGVCNGSTNIAPVGTVPAGAGLWGQLDLAGELWEWNLDWYAPSYQDPCFDCAVALDAAQPLRLVRGGYFDDVPDKLLPSGSGDGTIGSAYDSIGFRCARTP